jgi:hypothetical protein
VVDSIEVVVLQDWVGVGIVVGQLGVLGDLTSHTPLMGVASPSLASILVS